MQLSSCNILEFFVITGGAVCLSLDFYADNK